MPSLTLTAFDAFLCSPVTNTTSKLIRVDVCHFFHSYCAENLNSSLSTFDADGFSYFGTSFTFVSARTQFISSRTSC
jgi:hypothetical protein